LIIIFSFGHFRILLFLASAVRFCFPGERLIVHLRSPKGLVNRKESQVSCSYLVYLLKDTLPVFLKLEGSRLHYRLIYLVNSILIIILAIIEFVDQYFVDYLQKMYYLKWTNSYLVSKLSYCLILSPFAIYNILLWLLE